MFGYVFSAHDVNSVIAAEFFNRVYFVHSAAFAGHCCTIEKETEETENLQLQFKSPKAVITFGKSTDTG